MAHQPQEAGAGAADTSVAEPSLEDRFAAHANTIFPDDEEGEPPEENEEPAEASADAEPELTEEDVPEAEAEPEGDRPITPPVSWPAEEKERFAELPRETQEYLSKRESERERVIQRAQTEAAQTRATVESEAVNAITQLQQTYAQQLQALLPQIPPVPPRSMLDPSSADYDPDSYNYLRAAREDTLAQHQWVQQQLAVIGQQQTFAANAVRAQELQQTEAILREKFPEYLDPTEGPKLRESLGSIALELGYSADQLANVDANDILAMRQVATYKSKADKYDALMAKKMEGVRAAKGLPRVSRPGAARGGKVVNAERLQRDRQAMRGGDPDAAARVFSRYV